MPEILFYFHVLNCFHYLILLFVWVFKGSIKEFIYILFKVLEHIHNSYLEFVCHPVMLHFSVSTVVGLLGSGEDILSQVLLIVFCTGV